MGVQGRGGAGQTRRILYRQTKRMLVRLVAPRWQGHRYTLELAVRRFLRGKHCNELTRLATSRLCAMAAAASVLAAATAGTLPPVNLADVEAGIGGFVIKGVDTDDQSGWSVSGAGDVNGDGLADVVVGAIGADAGGDLNAGESYVVFGKADGAAVNLSAVAAGNGGFVIKGYDFGDRAGFSVSGGGDINGDGLDDLVVGAAFAGFYYSYAGHTYVVFGKADGAAVSLDAVVGGNGGFVMTGIDDYDASGKAVSVAGDVNGDGLADVIVGAYAATPAGEYSGESYVVFGKAGGSPVSLADVAAGNGGFVITGIQAQARSGRAVSGAGDINGDGLDDVLVGAYLATANGDQDAGQTYVILGKADGAAVDLADIIAGSGGWVVNGAGAGDYAGRSVSSAGDVNGDGVDDIVIGADRGSPSGAPDAGKSYVVFSPPLSVPGDLDGDGIVGIIDFLALLAAWGPCGDPCPPSCAGDLDRDCAVGIQDFLLLLANWS